MTAFLKASTDCFSMTLFEVPVFDCTRNKTVLVCVCFSTNLSMNEFRSSLELSSALSPFLHRGKILFLIDQKLL